MRITTLVAFFCLLALCLSASAQTSYRLAPEDTVTITVLRHPEFSGEFLIPPDGQLDLPGVGKLMVSGKTGEALAQEITQRLVDRLRQPEVTVSLRAPRIQRVYILGAVRQAGIFDLKAGWRITEALAAAGGLSMSAQDCRLTLLRAVDGKQIDVSITEVMAANPEANIFLASGDVLTAEVIERLPVYVSGAVKSAGAFEMRVGAGVTEALGEAGGLALPQDEVQVFLMRDGQRLGPLNGKNEPLHKNDVITVEPLRSVRTMVTGKVSKPGFCDLKDGEGIVEAITLAGGPVDGAALSQVKVTHVDGTSEIIDVSSAFINGKTDQNFKLKTGDLVIVPEATSAFAVLGYVNQPGYYPMQDGKKLLLTEALGMAKGYELRRGGIGSVAVLRTAETGKQERIIVDLQKFFKAGDIAANPEIKAGDIIYVPETKKVDWTFVFQTLSAAALVNSLIR